MWLAGSGTWPQEWCCTGLAVSQHVGSSQIRDGTQGSSIGRQILNQVLGKPHQQFFEPYYNIGEGNGTPLPVLLPGKSHGRRRLVGYSPWGRTESDTTERLHFHFSLSCIGEEEGTPLQCSCLENPRNGGAWWAAVCGVAQSRTRLK